MLNTNATHNTAPLFHRVKLERPLDSTPQYLWLTPKLEVMAFLDGSQIRVFHSICPHMGARLEPCAERREITCPWHGLSYNLDSKTSEHHRYKKICELSARVEGDTLIVGKEGQP